MKSCRCRGQWTWRPERVVRLGGGPDVDDGGTGDSIEGGPAGADCESLVDMGVALEGVARTS